MKIKLFIMFGEKENTEEKIMAATFKILKEEGVQKATTKKIATEAGVNEVTIFRKFENKKNLLNVTKAFYKKKLIEKLDIIFSFEEDEEIEEYLKNSFNGVLGLTQDDFSIIQVGMQEISEDSEKKRLLSEITDAILYKLYEFFDLQSQKGLIKENINFKAVAILCYSMIFQSIILWQIYSERDDIENEDYSEDFLNILYHGMLA